jgi:hypothetical protein
MQGINVKNLNIGYYLNDKNEVIHVNAIYDDSEEAPHIIDIRRIKDNFMEYYGTSSTCPWTKIEILEGQIWIPNDSTQEMVVITKAPWGNVLRAEGAQSKKIESYFIEDFLNMFYYDEVPEAIKEELEYGAYCNNCNKYSEYALKTANFICWACQNGYNG